MPARKWCLDCGRSADDVFISARGICRTCAIGHAVEEVLVAYEVAESLSPRTDDSLQAGIARATELVNAMYWASKAKKDARRAHRARLRALLRAAP